MPMTMNVRFQMFCALFPRMLCGLLDSWSGASFAGWTASHIFRSDVREVLPGAGRVQLLHESHHLLVPGQRHAQHLQADPVFPVHAASPEGGALRRPLQHPRARGIVREQRKPQSPEQRQTRSPARRLALLPELRSAVSCINARWLKTDSHVSRKLTNCFTCKTSNKVFHRLFYANVTANT